MNGRGRVMGLAWPRFKTNMMTNEHADMDSLYSEGKPRPVKKPKSIDEQEQAGAVQLMDRSAFKDGCEVGRKYTIEVVSEEGDDVQVKVVEAEKEPDKEPAATPEPAPDDDGLAELNSKY
jgi:hypothetical protein